MLVIELVNCLFYLLACTACNPDTDTASLSLDYVHLFCLSLFHPG